MTKRSILYGWLLVLCGMPGLAVAQTTPNTKLAPTRPSAVNKTGGIRPKTSVTLVSLIDPVCQMAVASNVADTAYYAGKHYGFCSKHCKARFKQQPTAYIKSQNPR